MKSPDLKSTDIKNQENVSSIKVSCDGGGGPSGHPKVYLDMGIEQEVICPYCSKLFVLNKSDK